ncbi:MAG TPA: hypothetical protein VH442_21560, partial [Micromonosporaceae bacterium]
MGTYPCSSCGAIADTATGCPSCGQSLDTEIATLDRTIVSMQQRNRSMVDERGALLARLQGAIAIRTMLQRAAESERGTAPRRNRVFPSRGVPMDIPKTRGGRRGRGSRGASAQEARQAAPGGSRQDATGGDRAAFGQRAGTRTFYPTAVAGEPDDASRGGTRTATTTRPGGGGPPPRVPPQAGGPAGGQPPRTPGSGGPPHPAHQPEASQREVQNLVLGLGAAVMAIALGLTPFIYTSLAGGLKALILASLTLVGLLLPVVFARRGLITTAEWIAPLGMLLILLDAQEAWASGLRRSGLSATVYAGIALLV